MAASGLLLVTGMVSVPTRALTFHSAPRAPHTEGLGASIPPTAPPSTGIVRTQAPVAPVAPVAPRPPAPRTVLTRASAASEIRDRSSRRS